MNINSVPVEALLRGAIVSVIDKTFPVIESFTDGEEVTTFAFFCGVPIPFNTFLSFMAFRFAPKRTEAMMPSMVANGWLQLPPLDHTEISCIWAAIKLPEDIRVKINEGNAPANIIGRLINDLYTFHLTPDSETPPSESFKALIRKIDEDYTMSLIDPIRI
jgi:hypothetical protein